MELWLKTHPYLLWSMVLLIILAVGLALCPHRLRWPTLLSALLTLPPVAGGAWVGRHYWSPVRVGHSFVGPEDFAFSFALGGLAWLLGVWPVHRRMVLNIRPRILLRRYLLLSALAATLTFGAPLLEMRPISGLLVPILTIGLVVLSLRPALWIVAVSGLPGYAILHFAILRTAFTLTPSWARAWHSASLWGPRLWAIPLDEIVWSVAVSAVLPVFTAYLFDARMLLPDQQSRSA